MSAARKKSFWQLLVEEGLITSDMLKEAVRRVQSEGGKMEEHLVALGLDDTAFARFISSRFRVPLTMLEEPPAPEVLALVPRDVAFQYHLVPFAVTDGKVFVALANPLVEEAYLELERVVGGGIVPFVAPLRRIREILNQFPESSPEGLAARFSLKARWAAPTDRRWDERADLPAQAEAQTALDTLRTTLPRLIHLSGPPGSGRTFLAVAWGQTVMPGGTRWAQGKVMEDRFTRLERKGLGDTLVEILASAPLLVVDDPGDAPLWERVIGERLQRGALTLVITGEKIPLPVTEILSRSVRVVVGRPSEDDAHALARHRGATLDTKLIHFIWKVSKGHLGRFSALLDSLHAAVGGDWSRVTPDLVKRLAT